MICMKRFAVSLGVTLWCCLSPLWCEAVQPYPPVIVDPVLEPWRWRHEEILEDLGVLCMAEAADGSFWFGGSGVPAWPPVTNAPSGEDDGDGRDNFYEYALNGDPKSSGNVGMDPALIRTSTGFQYVHVQRSDDPGLTYRVESTTNLMTGVWTNIAIVNAVTNHTGGSYDVVTNRVAMNDTNLFLRLRIVSP